MSKMQGAISSRDYDAAAQFVRENLTQIPAWARETKQQYGRFDISSIPSLQEGGRVLAFAGDEAGLKEMRRVIASVPDLEPWADAVDQHDHEVALFVAILAAVEANPGCLQTDLKGLLGEEDGHKVAALVSFLEKAGKLARVKEGKTYKLLSPGSSEIPAPPPKRIVPSHRTDRTPPKLREIDIAKLAYVPLPRSPLRWEEAQAGRERSKVAQPAEAFEVRDADWQITTIAKIPPSERPDPAFRQMYPRVSGLLLIDDLGKAEGLGQIEAAALCYGRDGQLTAKAALKHDAYWTGVHPLGSGMISLSKACVLHAYDDQLNLVLETALADAPEILALKKRLGLDEVPKSHIRCVALSHDGAKYLFTTVDEAWCIDIAGNGLWGVKLPIKDGWTRAAPSSTGTGTSADVDRALELMGLAFPFTPDEMKQRYRDLAKQWHPDRNLGDPKALEKMQALNAASEVLTGVSSEALPGYTGARFVREIDRHEIEAGGLKFSITMSMQVSELGAADWIYAASFAGQSDSVYLAGYSGRVVLVDENGTAVRAYDIGTVPRRIIDTGEYLYILTDTRLYVLRGEALHAVVDTFDGGELLVAETGFGLLEKKRLRWYSADGKYLGSVVAKDPIRRVYSTADGLVVESRQQRVVVLGTPKWWVD